MKKSDRYEFRKGHNLESYFYYCICNLNNLDDVDKYIIQNNKNEIYNKLLTERSEHLLHVAAKEYLNAEEEKYVLSLMNTNDFTNIKLAFLTLDAIYNKKLNENLDKM